MVAAIPGKTGPTRTVDLAAALGDLQTRVPSLSRVWMFGSRLHQTGSVRSDIDLLAEVGPETSLPRLATEVQAVEPYLDIFASLGSSAVSVANNSKIQANAFTALLDLIDATPVWEDGSWIGPGHLRDQEVLTGYKPPFTLALLGSLPLAVPRTDYLFVTALPTEFEATVAAIGNTTPHPQPVVHEVGSIETQSGLTKSVAVVRLPTPGMVAAALTTRRMLDALDVSVVVLLGIAGGIRGKDLALGDVVIPFAVFDYEGVKVTDEGDEPSGLVEATSLSLHGRVATAQFAAWAATQLPLKPETKGWFRTKPPSPSRVHTDCSMACGHKVIASDDRAQLLKARHRKALAVEMESFGVSTACRYQSLGPEFLVVKGISDFADATKNDRWHGYASSAAATLTAWLVRHEFL